MAGLWMFPEPVSCPLTDWLRALWPTPQRTHLTWNLGSSIYELCDFGHLTCFLCNGDNNAACFIGALLRLSLGRCLLHRPSVSQPQNEKVKESIVLAAHQRSLLYSERGMAAVAQTEMRRCQC